MKILDLPVEPRDKLGSANSRRYRRAGLIPTILYGRGRDNVPLTVSAEDFAEITAAHTLLIRLTTGEKKQVALLREVSWDVFGEHVQHIDLTRVEMDDTVQVNVPVHLHGIPAGSTQGGIVDQVLTELAVNTRVDSIPEEFVLDIHELEIGDGIHLDEIPMPEHVTPVRSGRDLIVHCVPPKKIEEEAVPEDEEAALLAEGQAPAEGEGPDAGESAPAAE